jgi:hypothetical protein
MPTPWVSLSFDQLILVNKAVKRKKNWIKGWRRKKKNNDPKIKHRSLGDFCTSTPSMSMPVHEVDVGDDREDEQGAQQEDPHRATSEVYYIKVQ